MDAYVEQFAEEIAAKIITNDLESLRNMLEDRIRAELQDSDELLESASEMAQDRRD